VSDTLDAADPLVQARLMAFKKRMVNDLAKHLPDEWLSNANAKDRVEFRTHMLTSTTVMEVLDVVAWTALSIEHEEKTARAGSKE
jgi:hypothetical protein